MQTDVDCSQATMGKEIEMEVDPFGRVRFGLCFRLA
jgi:hypothetical protein